MPTFAADPEAVLAEVESWRDCELPGDLEVEFVPESKARNPGTVGWYDPEKNRLMVVKGEGLSLDRQVLVREFALALQARRFDLARLRRQAHDVDAARALEALIEGEASLAVDELVPYEVGQQASLPLRGPITAEGFQRAFNQNAGRKFVQALRENGGWARVDAAFRNPPQRTAEILRPARYLEQTRSRDEDELFTAWRLTSYVVADYQPLGAYEVQLLLARAESLRPDAEQLAQTVVAGKKANAPETRWIILVSDADAAQAMLDAVWLAGATQVEALSPDPRMISFRPPPSAEETRNE